MVVVCGRWLSSWSCAFADVVCPVAVDDCSGDGDGDGVLMQIRKAAMKPQKNKQRLHIHRTGKLVHNLYQTCATNLFIP